MRTFIILLSAFVTSPLCAFEVVIPEKRPEVVILTKQIVKKAKVKLNRKKRFVKPKLRKKVFKVRIKPRQPRRYISQKTLDMYGGNVTVSHRDKTIRYRNR